MYRTPSRRVERYTYDAYGQPAVYNASWTVITEGASKDNAIRFCGYVYDASVGLYHVRHRTYNAPLGRWLQRDPAGYVDGMGLYEYCSSQVTAFLDPQGLWKRSEDVETTERLLGIEVTLQHKSHIWCAEEGDTLRSLAKKQEYGGDENNWTCLWPLSDTENHGYTADGGNIEPGDYYDASNLVTNDFLNPAKPYVDLDIRMNARDGAFAALWPDSIVALDGESVEAAIRKASGEGSTPIRHFEITGHSWSSGAYMGGEAKKGDDVQIGFWMPHRGATHKVSWERARQRKGPRRCWFARDAVVYLSARLAIPFRTGFDQALWGCGADTLADMMARKRLRRGARAIGPSRNVIFSSKGLGLAQRWSLQKGKTGSKKGAEPVPEDGAYRYDYWSLEDLKKNAVLLGTQFGKL